MQQCRVPGVSQFFSVFSVTKYRLPDAPLSLGFSARTCRVAESAAVISRQGSLISGSGIVLSAGCGGTDKKLQAVGFKLPLCPCRWARVRVVRGVMRVNSGDRPLPLHVRVTLSGQCCPQTCTDSYIAKCGVSGFLCKDPEYAKEYEVHLDSGT